MRRTFLWIMGIGCTGVAFALVMNGLGRNEPVATAEDANPAQAQPASGSEPEKVVFTFENEEKMNEFTDLWQQRQAMILRMTVLQSFWNEEQTRLAQLNKQLETQYSVDVSKNYYLDGDRRVLLERETPPQVPAPAATTP
jgi:hypothetical protein